MLLPIFVCLEHETNKKTVSKQSMTFIQRLMEIIGLQHGYNQDITDVITHGLF